MVGAVRNSSCNSSGDVVLLESALFLVPCVQWISLCLRRAAHSHDVLDTRGWVALPHLLACLFLAQEPTDGGGVLRTNMGEVRERRQSEEHIQNGRSRRVHVKGYGELPSNGIRPSVHAIRISGPASFVSLVTLHDSTVNSPNSSLVHAPVQRARLLPRFLQTGKPHSKTRIHICLLSFLLGFFLRQIPQRQPRLRTKKCTCVCSGCTSRADKRRATLLRDRPRPRSRLMEAVLLTEGRAKSEAWTRRFLSLRGILLGLIPCR